MEIIKVPWRELKPSEYNPRKLTEKQAKDLKESIKRFGLVEPIVVNSAPERKNVIIGGHQRFYIAKQSGMETIPVVYVNLPDIKKEQELNLRLNKNVGSWDYELLANFDEEMLLETGFESEELDEIFNLDEPNEKDDQVPDIPKEPISKLGEIYQLGRHRLMCGDSTKREDVEKLMDGKNADMVFTDPPYGIKMSRSESIKNDTLEGLENLLENTFNNILLVAKQNIPVYCWIGFRGYSIAEKVIKNNWKINNCIVWKKPWFGLGSKAYRLQHELCIFSGQVESRSESDVWEFNKDLKTKHPTVKPVELCSKGIINSSKSDDIVLDLFLGSGSTLIACEKTNRICYGMEIDPKYCDVIRKRYEQFVNKT